MPLAKSCTVDAEAGLIIGRRGRPIGNLHYSGYVETRIGGRSVRAHKVIWESVYGPLPGGLEINHINGIKHDNRISNLEAVSHAENISHAYQNGLCKTLGANHPRAILTPDAVVAIRASGERIAALSRKYGVSEAAISAVLRRQTWKEVESEVA